MLVTGVINFGATEQIRDGLGPGQLVAETRMAKPAGDGRRLAPNWDRCRFVMCRRFCSRAMSLMRRVELG